MIETPMFFDDAVNAILKKNPSPSEWDSTFWASEKPSVRVKSFLSARVENARFLDRAQGLIFDYLAGVRDDVTTPDGIQTTALRIGGRADFVRLMREFMVKEGMAKPGEFSKVNQNDLTEIKSEARLRLIFDTNVRQSFGYGKWRQGMSPAVRKAFPAARFIRVRGVAIPRLRHAANEGQVRLKTDFDFWARSQNGPEIGGFGVPWGPYGFRSGMDQEDVSKKEAAKLGLGGGDEPPPAKLPGFNDGWNASTSGMDPATKAKLLAELRGGPKPRDPEELARNAARVARRSAIERSMTKAEERGDVTEAIRLRSLWEAEGRLPDLPVVERGDRLKLLDLTEMFTPEFAALRTRIEDGTASDADRAEFERIMLLINR